MKAVQVSKPGGIDAIEIVEIPEPNPGFGQVSIDVEYAGINFKDLMVRQSGYQVSSFPVVLGLEVSGRINSIGKGVTAFAPGQSVCAFTLWGGQAEVAVADQALTFALDDYADLRHAAVLPTVVPTAYALLNECGRIRNDDSVLIHSAAGAMGVTLVQLAHHLGARQVVGTVSSQAKAEFANDFGFDQVVVASPDLDLRKQLEGQRFDLVFDAVGDKSFSASLALLAPFGRLVSFGNASNSAPWSLTAADLAPSSAGVGGFSISSLSANHPELLGSISKVAMEVAIEAKLRTSITHEFALDHVADAHRLMESRKSMGKLLLKL